MKVSLILIILCVICNKDSNDMQRLPMHEALKPLAWLKGTWRTKHPGIGKFPTIKDFCYHEEMKFVSIGQPMLNYSARSWNPETKNPMHYELGFLKIIPDTDRVYILLSHNFGVTTIEEGIVKDQSINLKTTHIGRPCEGTRPPVVLELRRKFELIGDCLQHTLCMATETTPDITEHLCATYERQCEE